ncbi:MAG: hypothetical protein ACTSW1_14005 [Candidatus Hodarchaeales archaeon]
MRGGQTRLILSDILAVKRIRTCYCGKRLVGDFCPVHGSEIRVESEFLNVRFSIPNIIPTLHLDLVIPRNQLIGYFNDSSSLINEHRDIIAEKSIEIVLQDKIRDIEEFFSHFDPFFGKNTFLLHSAYIGRKTGICLYFLGNYSLSSDQKRLIVRFFVLGLRNLGNYLKWRRMHIRSSKETIIESLINYRTDVFMKKGQKGVIKEVDWPDGSRLPSSILVEVSEDINLRKKAFELYHPSKYFLVGTKRENESIQALESIIGKFIDFFKNYCWHNSISNFTIRAQDSKATYEGFIGKKVKLDTRLLEVFGEYQNGLLNNHPLFSGSSKSKLLILSCSATKDLKPNKIPALLRYCGLSYLLVKALIIQGEFPSDIDVLIISGKHGLLKVEEEIHWYDQRIEKESIELLQKKIKAQIQNKSMDLKKYSSCFINGSSVYIEALKPAIELLDSNCNIHGLDSRNLWQRSMKMLEWLMEK